MPMYTFRCKDCGRSFEELVSSSRRAEAVCPACGGRAERSWKGSGAFSVGVSSSRNACDVGCAASCGCGGACRCGRNEA